MKHQIQLKSKNILHNTNTNTISETRPNACTHLWKY